MDSQYEQTVDAPVPVSSSRGNEMETIKVFEQTTDIWVFGFKQEDCRIQMGFLQCCQGSHICIGANAKSHNKAQLVSAHKLSFYRVWIDILHLGSEGEKKSFKLYLFYLYVQWKFQLKTEEKVIRGILWI